MLLKQRTRTKSSIAFLFSATLLFKCGCSSGQENSGAINLKPEEFQQLVSEKKGILVDVRTPAEFQESHIAGALLMNYYDPDFDDRACGLDTLKSILVYCRSGNRSSKAAALFTRCGFSRVYHLTGGLNAWNKEGLPVER